MDIYILAYVGVVGVFMGSFVNLVADRLLAQDTILGRSRCDHCRKTLALRALIPIVSFLWYRGKSVCCKKMLFWAYPVSEILTGTVYVFSWYYAPVESILEHILVLGLMSVLMVVVIADLKQQIIPDEAQIAALVAVTLLHLASGASFVQLAWYVMYGFGVMIPLLLIYILTKGKGMGFGDVKFAYIMGYLLGIQNGLLALYLAFVTGAVVGVVMLVSARAGMKYRIAFGPFLVVGLVLMYFTADDLSPIFLRIIGLT